MASLLVTTALCALACAGVVGGKTDTITLMNTVQNVEQNSDDPFLWLPQWINHLDPYSSADKWKQRYQFNDTYGILGGPVFLLLGGEGPIGADWLRTDTAVMVYARNHNATVFQLEHRFYGQSQPFGDQSTPHLRYLHSQQALADAATFVSWVTSKTSPYPITTANKWVVFGGSYPGALAAWFRLKYPHLAVGAVSSSAPLHIVLDFKEYLKVVQQSLMTTKGGDLCVQRLSDATKAVEAKLETEEGRQELAKVLRLCKLIRTDSKDVMDRDVGIMMRDIAEFVKNTVQYNKDNRLGHSAGFNMQALCDVMTNQSESALQQFGVITGLMLEHDKKECLNPNYDDHVREFRNSTVEAGADRTWWWQKCNEFAYFQTTDAPNATQPFGHLFPISINYDLCRDIFGVQPDQIKAHVEHTRTLYGDRNISTSNTVFVNGNIDPWHALGILDIKGEGQSVFSIVVPGAAHCADMYPPSEDDSVEIRAAREKINQYIGSWVQ